MKVGIKLVAMLVFVSTGLVFWGCQESNAPATGVKTEAKEAKPAVKAEVKETKPAAKAEVKEVKPEVKPEVKEEAKAPVAEPNAGAVDNGIAVTVNGKDITEAEVDAKIEMVIKRASGQIPPNMVEQYRKNIRPQAVDGMVMEKLLADEIKKANINITENDINSKLNEIITEKGMTMDMLNSAIAAQGQTLDDVKEQIKRTMSYEKLIGPVEVNDAEAKAFYNENEEDFNKPEEVKASHILVKVDASATPEQKAAAKAKIDGLLKQVKAGGDFAALAKENSDCPSKERGGDLGFFNRSAMVKEFADAAFAMKVGEVSGVVETQFGYHIIKVTDRKEGGVTQFEKAKADIVKSLQDKKKSEIFRRIVEKVRAEAKIVYPPGKEPKPRMPMMPRGGRPGAGGPPPEGAKPAAPAPQ
jgi:peptidyl-prolyl cis-trans isomerase C